VVGFLGVSGGKRSFRRLNSGVPSVITASIEDSPSEPWVKKKEENLKF